MGKKRAKEKKIPTIESPIKTPWRPKTTAWRHRSKAAAAEQALYTAALAQFGGAVSSRPSTSHMSIIGSRPSTAGHMSFSPTRPSTGYDSMIGIAGSVISDGDTLDRMVDPSVLQLRTENQEVRQF